MSDPNADLRRIGMATHRLDALRIRRSDLRKHTALSDERLDALARPGLEALKELGLVALAALALFLLLLIIETPLTLLGVGLVVGLFVFGESGACSGNDLATGIVLLLALAATVGTFWLGLRPGLEVWGPRALIALAGGGVAFGVVRAWRWRARLRGGGDRTARLLREIDRFHEAVSLATAHDQLAARGAAPALTEQVERSLREVRASLVRALEIDSVLREHAGSFRRAKSDAAASFFPMEVARVDADAASCAELLDGALEAMALARMDVDRTLRS
jgi:hypothetical protein